MPNRTLRYVIESDASQAVAETEKVNQANLKIGKTAEQGTRQASAGYGSMAAETIRSTGALKEYQTRYESVAASIMRNAQATTGALRSIGDAAGGVGHLIVKSTESALAGVLAFRQFATAVGGYSAAATGAGTASEGLLNVYRVLRIALSPTPFTVATVATGILADETIKLVYGTGQLIEARAALSARTGIDVRTLTEVASAGELAGKSGEYYLDILGKLKEQQKTGVAGLGLTELGLNPNAKATVSLLGDIGAAFENVRDPQERARVAFNLFGSDAEKILPELTSRFRDTTDIVRVFSSVLSNEQSTSIDLAKRKLDSLKDGFRGFFDYFKVEVGNFKTNAAVVGAAIINFELPGAGLFSSEDRKRLTDEAGLNGRSALSRFNAGNTAALANDSEAAFSIKERLEGGKSGVEAALEAAKARRREALSNFDAANKRAEALSILGRPGLSDDNRDFYSRKLGREKPITAEAANALLIDTQSQRGNFSQTIISADQQVSLLQSQSDAFGEADKAASQAATEAKALRTAIAGRQKAIRDQGYTAQAGLLDPFARSVVEFNKQGVDLTNIRIGDKVTNVPLSSDEVTARNEAFHALVLTHQREETKKATDDAAALHQLQLGYDAALFQRRTELRIQDSQRQVEDAKRLREFRLEELGFTRDSQIQALDSVNAQSVKQKIDLERTRADIETQYLTKSLGVRRDIFDEETNREAIELRRNFEVAGFDPKETGTRLAAFESARDQQRKNLGTSTDAAVAKVRDDAQTKSDVIQRDAYLKQFESIKQSAGGLLDSLFSRAHSLGEIVASFFKTAVLAPLEQIASSQIAKLVFEGVNPGQSVSFDAQRGSGRFSGISGVLNKFGLGGPSIRSGSSAAQTVAAQQDAGGFNPLGIFGAGPSIAARLALSAPLSLDTQEAIGAGANASGYPTLPGGLIDRTGSYSSSLDPSGLIGPGGTSGFAGPVLLGAGSLASTVPSPTVFSSGGVPVQGSGVGGSVLSFGQKALKGGADFFGFGDGPGGTYGSGNYGTGAIGALKSIGTSQFAATVGTGLVVSSLTSKPSVAGGAKSVIGGGLLGAHYASTLGLSTTGGALVGVGGGLVADGLHRGGFAGLGEDVGGGALIGFQYGGPVGALIGAAAGAIAGTIRLFISGDVEQIKKQVKDAYHLDINTSIANQLIQLAKQSYGGSFSVAIRSKPALDLLSLYAQSTNQSFLFDNTVRPAYLSETGGIVTQNSQLIGNKNYSFGGALAVTGGVPTSIIPSYVAGQQTIRTNGQNYSVPSFGGGMSIQLDGPATTALLQGQIVDNPRLVASANASAQDGSFDRRANAARSLSPGLIFG